MGAAYPVRVVGRNYLVLPDRVLLERDQAVVNAAVRWPNVPYESTELLSLLDNTRFKSRRPFSWLYDVVAA